MMNASRPAAAEQDRKTYREVTAQLGLLGLDPAIPEGVRDLAENTVPHTGEACDFSMDAFDASVAAFERSFEAAATGAATFEDKIVDTARRDINSSFDLATSLAEAKGLYDMVKSQAANWRTQVDVLTFQAEEVRALSAEATAAAIVPRTGPGVSR
jgi:hypothetical protein